MNTDRFKFRVFYGGDYSITPYCTIDMNGKVWLDTSIMRGDGLGDFDTDIIDITDKCTVEQCTGLRDRNGNLIYENDRVRAVVPDSRAIGETAGYSEYTKEITEIVKWIGGYAGFAIENINGGIVFFYDIADSEDIEIIGNIHEQKEQK